VLQTSADLSVPNFMAVHQEVLETLHRDRTPQEYIHDFCTEAIKSSKPDLYMQCLHGRMIVVSDLARDWFKCLCGCLVWYSKGKVLEGSETCICLWFSELWNYLANFHGKE
jgi:hypothetical protein